jgi:hypothetical protein
VVRPQRPETAPLGGSRRARLAGQASRPAPGNGANTCGIRYRPPYLCLCCLCAAASAQEPGQTGIGNNTKPTFTTFDAPGAAPIRATEPSRWVLTRAGVVVGRFAAAAPISCFVRSADGSITEFGAPGVDTLLTYAVAINAAGTVAGYDSAYTCTTQPWP